MRGFPKKINTKQDVYNLKDQYPDDVREYLQVALDHREGFVVTSKLDSRADGIEDDTHRIRTETDESGTENEWYQETWGILPGNTLDRIGMTVEEAERLIG